MQSWVGDDQSNIGIAIAEAAVLGSLLLRSRINGSIHWLDDDIGCSAIVRRVVESQLEFGACHHFVDEERISICVQISRNLRGGDWLALQPDQGNVIVCHGAAWPSRAIVAGIVNGDGC